MSIASRWAGWVDRTGGTLGVAAGPMMPAGEQTGTPKVELFIDEAWVDISPYVKYADGINIRRGRSSEGSSVEPTSCTFTLFNNDGRFTPRNPSSPYYGKIGRNTQVRISVLRDGTRRYRFYGEISSWPVRSDKTGQDVTVAIEASGPMRRIGQGASPLRSAIYRAVTSLTPAPIAYWPAEDTSGRVISAAIGGRSMSVGGTPNFASNTGFGGSDALPLLGTSIWSGKISDYTSSAQEAQIRFLMYVPTTASPLDDSPIRIHFTGTNGLKCYLVMGPSAETYLWVNDDDDVGDGTATITGMFGVPVMVSIELWQSGSSVAFTFRAIEPGSSTQLGAVSGSLASHTLGSVSRVVVNPNYDLSSALSEVAIGHIFVQDEITPIAELSDPLAGGVGETAGDRYLRLTGEEDLVSFLQGDADSSVLMGTQPIDTLQAILTDIQESDGGISFESREAIALTYRTRESMQNQDAKLTLDYAAHELNEALTSLDDDKNVRNDITVKRTDGGSYRSVLEEGSLSVQTPPNGVGRYDESVELSLYDESQMGDVANWRLHMGTVDEPRFPSLTVQLAHPAFTSDPALAAQVLSCDLGDRVVVTNMPSWLPPDDISQLIMGYTERIDQFEHVITFNTAPESPWHVAVYDTSRYDTAGSELTSDITSDATSISVTTTLGPVWVQDAGEMPFDIKCGGERMTVTAVSGATSPQTFTVTRSVNGVVKAHSAGTSLSLFDPAVYAL